MSYKYIIVFFLVLIQSNLLLCQVGNEPCASQEMLTSLIQKNPSLAERFQIQEVAISEWIANQKSTVEEDRT